MRFHPDPRFRRAALPLGICALLACAACGGAEDVEEPVYESSLTAAQASLVSASGADILDEVAQARAAISQGDGMQARKHVTRARALLGEVQAVSPAVHAEHEIGHVLGKIRNQKAMVEDLVPVYEAIDMAVDPEQVAEIRAHVDRAKGHLQAIAPRDLEAEPHWNAAADELIEACSKMTYLEIDLPIHETWTLLSRAHEELRHDKLDAADASLAEVRGQVEVFVASASGSAPAVGAGPGD